jgi:hypothetical protein
MFKRAIAIAVLLAASISPASAEDLSYLNRWISWADNAPFLDSPVAYLGAGGAYTPCTGGWSTSCDPSVGDIRVANFLPICATSDGLDKRIDCLEDVYVDLNGIKVKGEPLSDQISTWDAYSFSAKPEFGIAKSSPSLIYKFPGLSHSKGNLFMVHPSSAKFVKKGTVGETRYTFLIAPTFQESGKLTCERLKTPGGLCWVTGSFLSDTRFTLNVKMATAPVGWFTSRITSPDIKINPAADGRIQVSFTGNSQAIPSINRNFQYTVQSEQDEWNQVTQALPLLPWEKLTTEGKKYSAGWPYGSDSIDAFQTLVSKVPSFNNADAVKNIWRIESISSDNASSNQCLKSGFTGVVSSNSLTYENAIPTWDAANSALVYRIASPHSALGNEFSGRYDLLISAQVAKCLWSLKNLTPAAEINVTSATGEKKVFTASSSIENDFYRFTAAGFTFSTNKISIKMLPAEKTSITTEIVQPTPKVGLPSVAIKKSTITCIKGKTQKKVTAIKPKCPTGYKKK